MDLWSIALEERVKADEERRKSKNISCFVTSYYGNTVFTKGLEQQGRHDGDTNLFFMGSPRCVSIQCYHHIYQELIILLYTVG